VPSIEASGAAAPRVALSSLDTLWFQVAGTVCNLACAHCFVSSSPTNRTHEFLSLEAILPYLEEAAALGVKELYFTGGEPFLNPEMESILEQAVQVGPVTVLTNGLLLDPERCRRLSRLAERTDYSLDFRVSLDGYDPETNDPIRGEGTFGRILRGVSNLVEAGLNPVITVTEVYEQNSSESGKERFFELLRDLGVAKPRLKMLSVFQIGAEAERTGAYKSWQRLRISDTLDEGWSHLQCSSCRMVTDQGVWVCPILVNEPQGKMGQALSDTLEPFALEHPACWTCHVYGVSCKT
jgi:MoaA/NifB/PqqE/SkfB family radical SAM enzyme